MTEAGTSKLYTPEILGLAVGLAQYPFDDAAEISSEARSRSCGSTLAISIKTQPDGSLDSVGLRVVACAIGQAAAMIFARGAKGKTPEGLMRARDALAQWLAHRGAVPEWAGIEILDAARHHPARHDAIMMPWRAAIQALSIAATPS